MRLKRIFLVGLPDSCQATARAAAQQVFPGAEVVVLANLREARAVDSSHALELLVLHTSAESDVSAAIQASDGADQTRWAVVVLGGQWPDLAETVPPAEWTLPTFARTFSAVVREEELVRENLRLKGDLKTVARRIRHDLFTPVGCVTTSAHVLEMLSPEDRATMSTMVENIKVSSDEITQLIERIAFVLRASAEAPQSAPVEMGEIVSAVLKQLEPECQKAGASITTAESWPAVSGIAPWLHVIWQNLVDNALKHGGPAPKIRLAWEAVPDAHRFAVTDSGAGVAAGRRPHLFRPFEELHEQTAPGLGLSIVQRLVALQGGTCGYEHRTTGSTTFFFTLPA